MVRLMGLVCAVLAFAVPSSAQVYTGRIDLTVADTTGAVLPGVTVDITGPRDDTATTDDKGEAHFLNLPVGTYTVTAKLSGFTDYVNKEVPVTAGASVPLKVSLAVGGVTAAVEVVARTPTLDPKKTAIATHINLDELQKVPSARDPWVVLQTVPGVVVDRVNVGGSESGQQSDYTAKGAASTENTWNMDGVPITDMSSFGSPTYYDFDMFQEMQVTTGGADVHNATPGVALNLVLKAGSNTPHGSTRYYFENDSLQSNNLSDALKVSLGGTTGKGNRIDKYQDRGFELGGPIQKDHVWAWGSISKTDVEIRTLNDLSDRTYLPNYAFKGTGQVTRNLRASFTFFDGVKNKYGRDVGPTRPQETSYDQGGPTKLYKGEVNYIVGSNVFLTGRYAHVKGGFFLTPEGGLDKNMVFADDNGIGRFTWYEYRTNRPQDNAQIDGNLFKGRHEVKFGVGYRTADVDSSYTVPGNGIITFYDGYPNMFAGVTAWNHFEGVTGRYTNFYLSDTLTAGKVTANLGVRFDRQTSSVHAYSQKGNPLLPDLLPDLTGQAANDVIKWDSLAPRIGLSYSLDAEHKSILRASYSRFAAQLNAAEGGFFTTVTFRGVYFYTGVTDKNGNGTVDAAEIAGLTCTVQLADAGACGFYGFDLTNPGNVGTPNHKIGSYHTPMTDEIVLGADHELIPNFGVSANFTWRRFTHFNWRPVQGLRTDDYVQLGTLNGNDAPVGSYSVPYFGVSAAAVPANRTATEYVDREGYHQRYLGFEVSADKRLANRWMARFGFSTNSHREYFDDINGHPGDPTPTPSEPNINGGDVARQTIGGGKSGIYLALPRYQFILTGLYQGPMGINFGANVVSRQGYAAPYYRDRVATGDPLLNQKSVLVAKNATQFRLPSVTSVDARVEKAFKVQRYNLSVDLDVFNALNAGTVLKREYNLRLPTANQVREIMSPRIFRLGVRFNF